MAATGNRSHPRQKTMQAFPTVHRGCGAVTALKPHAGEVVVYRGSRGCLPLSKCDTPRR